MTPTELKNARNKLGLTQSGLAARMLMSKHGGRTVRRWEAGEIDVPGPVALCIGYMLAELNK